MQILKIYPYVSSGMKRFFHSDKEKKTINPIASFSFSAKLKTKELLTHFTQMQGKQIPLFDEYKSLS